VFETVGVAGIVISMLAYVPQVVHLGRQHCSAGISRRAWAMWLVSSLLVGTLAVHRGDEHLGFFDQSNGSLSSLSSRVPSTLARTLTKKGPADLGSGIQMFWVVASLSASATSR
jgi:uncharacterized protein with PQ loop repeat